jgi:glycosyltransferase involved in cell wall biosynthesis
MNVKNKSHFSKNYIFSFIQDFINTFVKKHFSQMNKLSAVIITFNEERNILHCLNSLHGIVDEIIVVDSFSFDKTEEICKNFGVSFIQSAWKGYSESKNFANSQANFDWILSLDADEVLSKDLQKSILEEKRIGFSANYEFNRLTNYCGKWIRHGGWYPDKKVRLFEKEFTSWAGEIHEELIFKQSKEIKFLKGDCLHYSYYSLSQHYNQAQKFTTIAAKDLVARGKKAPLYKLIFSPIVKFIRDYFLKLGFLDGKYGFIVARISAYATYLKYKKIRQFSKLKTTKI